MESPISDEIRPVVESMGFRLIEVSVGRAHRLAHVRVVVYSAAGVGVDDCAAVSRLLRPRLEIMEGLADLSLEVSSPGIDRRLKSNDELAVFHGKGVRLLLADEADWIGGVIGGVDQDSVTLERAEGPSRIPLARVRRARLDHTQEVAK